ncbi:MAG: hypothetical protein NTW86_15715, partial [Candidatus Sumerlaeota bacterium]|nr:hypothetical protein [Candidatus Sumerlaeota bacterium]
MNAIGRASCLWFALGMATWALMASEAGAGVLYVRADAAPGGDGSSWERACNRLQDALERAKAGDDVWVAAGTYYPTDTGDHEASFALKQGVAVYGGFAGRE